MAAIEIIAISNNDVESYGSLGRIGPPSSWIKKYF